MCRSIKVLRTASGQPSESELREAALQFVRKISGYRVPSKVNAQVFEAAVDDIAAVSRDLLASLVAKGPSNGRPLTIATTGSRGNIEVLPRRPRVNLGKDC